MANILKKPNNSKNQKKEKKVGDVWQKREESQKTQNKEENVKAIIQGMMD